MHIVYPALVAALLFSIGVYGVLARRNTILVLMSVELMLNAVNLNLVAFDVWLGDRLHSGQVLTLFVIVIAAAEVGVGLAIILALYRNRKTVDIDHLRDLAEPADDPSPEDDPGARSASGARMPATAVPALIGAPTGGPPPRSRSEEVGGAGGGGRSGEEGRAVEDGPSAEGLSGEEGRPGEDPGHLGRGGAS
nr:NADH-quinone oxidoreductase subunit NuoK [Nonomuraea corallina]